MRKFLPGLMLILSSCSLQVSAQEMDPQTVMLETFGAVSGIVIYNTYIVLGTVADGFEGEVYDSATVITYIDEQVAVLQNLAEQFRKVYDARYMTDEGDQAFLLELETACNLLRDQALALTTYVIDGTDEKADAFQEKRTMAWDKIAWLLEIE